MQAEAQLLAQPAALGAAGADQAESNKPVDRTGLVALCLLARLHHVAADPEALSHQLGLTPTEPIAAPQILLASQQLGLKAKATRTTAERLNLAALPALSRGTG